MTSLAVVLSLLVGLTLGLLGGGGSILTVPVLVYALGIEPKLAVVMSLPIVGGAAFIGAVQHWRLGHVELRSALPFGLVAMLGAFAGAQLAHQVSGTTQMIILAAVMVLAAGSMLRSARADNSSQPLARRSRSALLAVGAATGILTGLVGVGGGFLMVPALVLLGGLPMSHAIGTSLLVIAMNTATGYVGHHGTVVVPWNLVAWFFALTTVGILAGGRWTDRVPQQALKRAFACLLLGISALLLWQNLIVH